ncbi:MAG: DUF4280 domain-containing protein [Paracoccaceae bacterium]
MTTAQMKCSMGSAPSTFVATPKQVRSGNQDAGNIMDHKPLVNIPPFGTCMSLGFPATASATSAAMGALTPMPCIPNTPAPWITGALTVPTSFFPALNDTACLTCIWGGLIKFSSPGQAQENIP